MISEFKGVYRFLSNFHPSKVMLDGIEYPTVEHAYQAAKTLNPIHREYVLQSETPSEAKRRGKAVVMRPDWDDIKLDIMLDLIRQKFQHKDLRSLLIATDNQHIQEGNKWGDKFWGTVDGFGENHLGKILMCVREELVRKEMRG